MKMNTSFKKFTAPLALAGLGLGVGVPMASTAFATRGAEPARRAATSTYSAQLTALNHSSASGSISISLDGDQATVTEHTSGLAAMFNGDPYPHVQHIHIDGAGQCPSTSADTNGDGVISTTEGGPAYGPIGTSLTLSGDTSPAAGTALNVAPSGGGYDYSRTITLDSKTVTALTSGKAVVVVHGLDPATLSAQAQGEMSDLVPSLPLAATSPTLCGVLTAQASPTTTTTAVPSTPTTSRQTPTTVAPAPPMAPMQSKATFTG